MRGPRDQGRLPFEYEVVADAGQVTSYGGLPLVVDAMRSLGVSAAVREHVRVGKRPRAHDEVALVEALVVMMAAGGDCLDDLAMLGADGALMRLLDRAWPSPETARKFLYAFHEEALLERARQALPAGETSYVPEENEALRGLSTVQRELVAAVAEREPSEVATVDLDATIIESHKREALAHYDGGRGYQPVLAVWAEKDLVLCDEFRDGNVPAGKDTLRVTKAAFAALPAKVTQRRFRSDSAAYNVAQMLWLASNKIEFTLSADMTAGLRAECANVREDGWRHLETRSHEEVHVSEVIYLPSDWPEELRRLRTLVIRFTPTQGRLFEQGGGPKYLAVVTNRRGRAEELLRWHWEKAGTIEHVHDVIKNDLGGGVLPCSRFGANAAWFRLSALTYNILSALRRLALNPRLRNARPKRLRFEVFTIPALVSKHARQLWARLVERLQHATELARARRTLWQLQPAPS